MSFFLDKLLSVFAFPLGFAIAAVVLLLVIGAMGRRRFSQVGLALVVAGLWIVSTPHVASLALKTLEEDYRLMSIAETPQADVLIVLGGGIRPPNSSNPFPDLGDSSDRLVHALRLWKAGKAPKLLLVGRGNGWGSDLGS